MMTNHKLLVASVLLYSCAVNVSAQPDEQTLEMLLQAIDTLSADVVQLIVESDGGVLEESEIHMYLKKPNGFYWETLSPFPELVVINDDTLWNYVPDLEQVVVEDWDWESDRSELAAQLLSGRTENLSTQYAIVLVAGTDSEYQEFELTPLASDSIYEQISINFLAAELDMIYLNNKNGQKTVWQFENAVRNQPLEDSLFEFVPPDGIEVIENNYTR